MDKRIDGIYAITPDEPDSERLVGAVTACLEAGVRWVQYRNKGASRALRRHQALALRDACASYGAQLIVNDDVELACDIGAAGAHIGASDGALGGARGALGPMRILGVSCYADVSRAVAAQRAGADYAAFGSVFASPTKPGAARAGLSLFAEVRALGVELPLVGIGGIDLTNVEALAHAGASAAAIITAIFSDFDPPRIQERARALSARFLQSRNALQ